MRGFIDGEYQDGEIRGLTFVAGMRGMGKTTLMGKLLSSCSGDVVFFDSLSKHDQVLKGYRCVSQPGELENFLRANRGRRSRLLYQPRAGDLGEHHRAVCTIVRAFGSMIFGTDELDMLCGAQWGDKRMSPEFSHLVHYGRHSRVSMLATARRPMDVARGFTSQCGEMRLFAMRERADLKYFENYIGSDVERLPTLGKYQYLHWTGNGAAVLKGPGK